MMHKVTADGIVGVAWTVVRLIIHYIIRAIVQQKCIVELISLNYTLNKELVDNIRQKNELIDHKKRRSVVVALSTTTTLMMI